MKGGQELYSWFGFFQAVYPDVYTAAITGPTLDMRDYAAINFLVNINSFASAGDNGTNCFKFCLQHGTASAAGVDQWSLVPGSQLIGSVYGGYASTAETGVFAILESKTDLGGTTGASGCGTYIVGYKKDTTHRYIRIFVSISGNASAAWMGAEAMFGSPNNWPVNSPV